MIDTQPLITQIRQLTLLLSSLRVSEGACSALLRVPVRPLLLESLFVSEGACSALRGYLFALYYKSHCSSLKGSCSALLLIMHFASLFSLQVVPINKCGARVRHINIATLNFSLVSLVTLSTFDIPSTVMS
jgi:hypothetical protein